MLRSRLFRPKTGFILQALISVLFWSLYFPFAKPVLTHIDSISFAFIRFFFGFLTITIFVILKNKKELKKLFQRINYGLKNSFFLLLLSGIVGIALHQIIQVKGLSLTSASNTAWILAFVPANTFILSLLFLKEKSNFIQITGLIIAFSGILLLTDFHNVITSMANNRNGISAIYFGNFLIFLSSITWAIYTIISKKILQYFNFLEMLPFVFLSGILGLFIGIIVTFHRFEPFYALSNLTVYDIIIILFSGIFPAGIGYITWFNAIDKLGAAKTTFFVYLEPLLTTFISITFFNEHFEFYQIFASGLTLLGLILLENSKVLSNLITKKIKK